MRLEFQVRLRRGCFELDAAVADQGLRFGLFGPSGSGKSSLVRALAGLDNATGRIRADEETWLDSAQARSWPPPRRRVGWVPQDAALFPHLNVRENLTFGVHADPDALPELLALLDLEPLLSRRTDRLSGGEQRRVALARAMLSRPRLLLLDEPFTGLDEPRKRELIVYLLRALRQQDIPSILVSHDPAEIGMFCERVWLLDRGRIVGRGSSEEVFLRPETTSQAQLAGIENLWPGEVITAHDRMATVAVGANRLHTDAPGLDVGMRVTVVLAAGEILLSRAVPAQSSARNVWPARITEICEYGREVSVHLGASPAGVSDPASGGSTPVVALITPASLSELELRRGDTLYAVFKASAARVFPS